ncbi:hypothetical protein D3C71_1840140 [compost metagenome]
MRKSMETELGREVQCAACKNFWPADGEFFFMDRGRLRSRCRACEKDNPTRQAYRAQCQRRRNQGRNAIATA